MLKIALIGKTQEFFEYFAKESVNEYEPALPEPISPPVRIDLFHPRQPRSDNKYEKVRKAIEEFLQLAVSVRIGEYGCEDLDAIVVGIADVDPSGGIDRDPLGILELTIAGTNVAEAQQMIADSVNRALSAEELSGVFSLFATCSRGRAAIGRGDDCIGDRLPTLLTDLGLVDLQVFQNERVHCINPPYSETDREQLQQSIDFAKKKFWLWDKADARILFEAGGGAPAAFAGCYEASLAWRPVAIVRRKSLASCTNCSRR